MVYPELDKFRRFGLITRVRTPVLHTDFRGRVAMNYDETKHHEVSTRLTKLFSATARPICIRGQTLLENSSIRPSSTTDSISHVIFAKFPIFST